jgi:integrase
MLLLMARLGLRSPEVIAIPLDDIDWRAGEILIRGEGKLHETPAAITRNERPTHARDQVMFRPIVLI